MFVVGLKVLARGLDLPCDTLLSYPAIFLTF